MFTLGIPAVFLGGALSDRLGRAKGAAWIFAASGACSLAAGGLAPVVAGAILDEAGPSGWKPAFAFNAALALPAIACLIALGGIEKGR